MEQIYGNIRYMRCTVHCFFYCKHNIKNVLVRQFLFVVHNMCSECLDSRVAVAAVMKKENASGQRAKVCGSVVKKRAKEHLP